MKVLAYTSNDHNYGTAICELSSEEMNAFLGYRQRPRVGLYVEPCKRVAAVEGIINRAKDVTAMAEQLRALAALLDTTIPNIDAIVNPPPVPEPATAPESEGSKESW